MIKYRRFGSQSEYWACSTLVLKDTHYSKFKFCSWCYIIFPANCYRAPSVLFHMTENPCMTQWKEKKQHVKTNLVLKKIHLWCLSELQIFIVLNSRVCLKLFTRNSDVKAHILRVHCGDRRYPCTMCGKRFDLCFILFYIYSYGIFVNKHTRALCAEKGLIYVLFYFIYIHIASL